MKKKLADTRQLNPLITRFYQDIFQFVQVIKRMSLDVYSSLLVMIMLMFHFDDKSNLNEFHCLR